MTCPGRPKCDTPFNYVNIMSYKLQNIRCLYCFYQLLIIITQLKCIFIFEIIYTIFPEPECFYMLNDI